MAWLYAKSYSEVYNCGELFYNSKDIESIILKKAKHDGKPFFVLHVELNQGRALQSFDDEKHMRDELYALLCRLSPEDDKDMLRAWADGYKIEKPEKHHCED